MQEETTTTELEPFEVRSRAWTYGLEAVVWAIMLVASVTFLVSGLSGAGGSALIRALLSTVFGSLGVVISVAGGRNLLRLVSDPLPALQVTKDGLLNRTYWHSATLVPWEDVLDIRKTRFSWILEVVLRDPEEYRSRQTLTTRLWMRLTALLGAGPFPLYLSQLGASRSEVTRKLAEARETMEIAAIREHLRLEAGSGEEAED